MIDKTKCPEKSYFSVDDIAERWGCDSDTVVHFIYVEGSLRSAAIISKSSNALCGIRIKDLGLSEDQNEALEILWNKVLADQDISEVLDPDRIIIDLPEFLYVIPSCKLAPLKGSGIYPNGDIREPFLETLEGDYIAMLKDEGEGRFTPFEAYVGTLHDFEDGFADIDHVISKEERDRFELEHGMIHTQEPSKVSEKELLTPFNLPPKLPNDAARVMCEQGNVLANVLGRTPTQSELRSFILKDNVPYIHVGELDTGDIDIGDCRVSKRGFADRYRKYLTPQKT